MHQVVESPEETPAPPEHPERLKICLVTCFPPSRGDLNEYGFHLASALRKHPEVELTLLADEMPSAQELDGFQIERCWRFNSLSTPARLMRAIRQADPDVVWFNMGFSTFARAPLPAFLSIAGPAITRASGFYTHVTLHTLFERINLKDAGVALPAAYRAAGRLATRVLLSANDVTVLLPSFRAELIRRYKADSSRVHFRPHGTFSSTALTTPAALNHKDPFVLAFGYWGTYKRLESLLESWSYVSQQVPGARLLIVGLNHPSTPGYLEFLQAQYAHQPSINFLGYVAEDELPSLFRRTSVLVLPYSSAAGTSGVVHQACEYGLPIVATAIPEIQELAREQHIAVEFFPPGDSGALKLQLVRILKSDELRREMVLRNLSAGSNMQISQVVGGYLELFKLRTRARRKPAIAIHEHHAHSALSTQVGNWLLHSGIEEPAGGVARYHLARERRNKPVSTEITGYCASALIVLHQQTGEQRYLDSAIRLALFLANKAWNPNSQAMPFEVEGEGQNFSYFFDLGIIVRGLLAVWRKSRDKQLLAMAIECGNSMARDFAAAQEFHPILTLPAKQPLPHEKARWSRSSGCYQLKAGLAWKELSEAAGDDHFNRLYRQLLRTSLDTHLHFLPGIDETLGVMDRLHAYSYFLEGLLPSIHEDECRQAMTVGIDRLAYFANEIAPEFLRSDVIAQLLRVRMFADQAGVVPLNRETAEHESSLLLQFQSHDPDPRLYGGFWFGRKRNEMLPFMNPVSTVFCYQALNMWSRYQQGHQTFLWQNLI